MKQEEWEKKFDDYFLKGMGNDDGYSQEREVAKNFIHNLLLSERAHWLRSEIEKLEGMLKELDGEPLEDWNEDISWNQALATIITRYTEELKVLESK